MNFLTNKIYNTKQRDNNYRFKKILNNNKDNTLEANLNTSKFRMLNEMLYTSYSNDALHYFNKNSNDFKIYHEGFSNQAKKWPVNPNNVLIKELKKKKYLNKRIIDLGCGEAFIAKELNEHSIKNKLKDRYIKSFDIQSLNDRVTISDIKNLPLDNNSIDIAIFCLSLMGKNFIEFIIEANRVLKKKGVLFVAEIESRIKDIIKFENTFTYLGFRLIKKKELNGYFKIFVFKKSKDIEFTDNNKCSLTELDLKEIEENSKIKLNNKKESILYLNKANILKNHSNILTPCLYKKR